MKRLVVFTLLSVMAFSVSAQDDAISKFFQKYSDDPDFSEVNITGRMFSLLTDLEIEDEEDQAILDAISQLSGLKVLARDNTSRGKELYREAYSLVSKNKYEELMSIRDEDMDMKFLIKEEGNQIKELLMIGGGDDEFFIMSIFGIIDLKQISKISKKMNIDGLEKLEKLNDN
ncbi:MAG: DUF4252 domain-containing protein [Bacteroidota bacterium]